MKKFLRNRGLAFKMIFFIFISVSVVFTIIFFYNYRVSRSIIEYNLRENAKNLTYLTVHKVERILASVQKVPDNLAKILESTSYPEWQLISFLTLIVDNNPEIYGATIAFEPKAFDGSSHYFAPYVFKKNGGVEVTDLNSPKYDYFTMDWYQIPKELGRPVWSEPYFDEGAGNEVMSTYSVPLYRMKNGKQEFFGILTADVSLNWLQKIVSSVKVYKTGYGFMISKNGSMVTHPLKDMIMNETIFTIAEEQKSPQLRTIGQNMIKGDTSFAEIEYRNVATGKMSWLSYAPVTVNGWSIGIVWPVEEFMADVNNLYYTVFVIGIAGSVLLLVTVILISRSITGSLRSLSSVAEQFGQGNFNVPLPPIESHDEIGKLTESFVYMQNALDMTIMDLKETSDNLRVSNEKLEEYSKTLEEKVDERTKELSSTNKELNTAFKNVKTLSEIGQRITSTLNFEDIQKIIYENVNSILDASSFLIMVMNETENRLECKMSIEKGEYLPPFNVSMTEKTRFAVWCAEKREAVFMNDVENEYIKYVPHRAPPKAGETVSSLIYLPLMVHDRVVGVISAQSFRKFAYTQYHLDMMKSISTYASIAIANARSFEEITKANKNLKEAQDQLVQAEKMASLGQLTAGIAHEIKNPLNFINNFSELSADLTREITEELESQKDKMDEKTIDYINELLSDLQQNVKKINEHGKRADSIVKGMLLHSRGKSGEMQKTDINALLNEYVHLAYHGMRAQDTAFNVKIETIYDQTIKPMNVVPQNISRVFLNIVNNACYAAYDRKKEKGDSFTPTLTVSTKNLDSKIEVRIRDNGKGIPKEIRDKIFNPFFTTKPTGKGTGLGLSLSFDIVVQEHKGEVRVESEEGSYAEFIITLPTNL